ncbi:MAG: NUDIX hydrolase [Planctomycetes bacterium]|nr:NUDIX hydrolase [Planctomycetota bacterium]
MFDDQHPLKHAIVAIIEDGDDVLMIERAPMDTWPGYWSAVTGSMEAGETQQHAIVRECMEEVGLRVKPRRKLWESITKRAHFVLHWWQCELIGPRDVTPDPSEVSAYRWVKRNEISRMKLMFGDSRWFYSEMYPITRRATDTGS